VSDHYHNAEKYWPSKLKAVIGQPHCLGVSVPTAVPSYLGTPTFRHPYGGTDPRFLVRSGKGPSSVFTFLLSSLPGEEQA